MANRQRPVFSSLSRHSGRLLRKDFGERVRMSGNVIDQAQSMNDVLHGGIVAMPLNRLIASIETDRNNRVSPQCPPGMFA